MIRSPRSSPESRLAATLLLAGTALLGAATAGAQPDAAGPEEVQAKARAVLADQRFQRVLPAHPEPQELDDSGRRSTGFAPGGPPPPQVPFPAIGAGAFLAKIVFLVLLAVAVLLLAAWVAGTIVERRRAREKAGEVEDGEEPVPGPEREPAFEDAARLAAGGRYAEAIHALLLAAIRHYAEWSRTPVQPSRTSRELIRLLPLGTEAREAFTELVRAVELSLFGGAPVGAEDYERSLSRFRLLTRRPA